MKTNNKTVVVRFEGGSRWIDTTMPAEALSNPRIFARWMRAFTKRNRLDWRDISCSGISQVARGWGHNWHHIFIPLHRLYWGKQ